VLGRKGKEAFLRGRTNAGRRVGGLSVLEDHSGGGYEKNQKNQGERGEERCSFRGAYRSEQKMNEGIAGCQGDPLKLLQKIPQG